MSSTQKVTASAKIVPHLWFVDNGVEAANFYVSLFPDSRVDSATPARTSRLTPTQHRSRSLNVFL